MARNKLYPRLVVGEMIERVYQAVESEQKLLTLGYALETCFAGTIWSVSEIDLQWSDALTSMSDIVRESTLCAALSPSLKAGFLVRHPCSLMLAPKKSSLNRASAPGRAEGPFGRGDSGALASRTRASAVARVWLNLEAQNG